MILYRPAGKISEIILSRKATDHVSDSFFTITEPFKTSIQDL